MSGEKGEDEDRSIGDTISSAIKDQINKLKSVKNALRYVVLGGPLKIAFFLLWIAIIVVTVIYPYNIDPDDLPLAFLYIYTIVDGLRYLIFFAWLIWFIAGRKLKTPVMFTIALINAAILTIIPFILIRFSNFILDIFYWIIVIFFSFLGIGASIGRKIETIGYTGPVIKKLVEKPKLHEKNFYPSIVFSIEMTAYLIFRFFFLHNLLPESFTDSFAYSFLFFGDISLNGAAVAAFLILAGRKDPFHAHLRKFFIWLVPLAQGWAFIYVIQFYMAGDPLEAGMTTGFTLSSVTALLEIIVFIIMAIWELGSNISDQLKKSDKVVILSSPKRYTGILWLYVVSIYSTQNEILGLEDVGKYFIFYVIGIGIFLLVTSLGKKTARMYGIENFNFLNFWGRKLVTIDGTPISPKEKVVRHEFKPRTPSVVPTTPPAYQPARPTPQPSPITTPAYQPVRSMHRPSPTPSPTPSPSLAYRAPVTAVPDSPVIISDTPAPKPREMPEPQPQYQFCGYCGAKYPKSQQKFCSMCGKKL
ncbi:MAG: hypothetical protein ACFFCS_21165 [Candidatus Hodarchaeota archaeon]